MKQSNSKFGFLVENIAPFNSKQGKNFFGKALKDCLLTQTEKKALFNNTNNNTNNTLKFGKKKKGSKGMSKKQEAHQKRVKKVGELRKKHGLSLKDCWAVVKKEKTLTQVKKMIKGKTIKSKVKSVKGKTVKSKTTTIKKRKTKAQQNASKAMKLHHKEGISLAKAWVIVRKGL